MWSVRSNDSDVNAYHKNIKKSDELNNHFLFYIWIITFESLPRFEFINELMQ